MKKGFTLAELIGVIVVLSLICLITVPAVSNVLKENKNSLCKTQLKNVLMAANSYASENLTSMPVNDGETKTITIGDLIENGYIDGTIKNPVNKEPFDEEIEITIEKVGKKLKIDFTDNGTDSSSVYNLCVEDENE